MTATSLLGHGRLLSVGPLARGEHVITLQARDADGNIATASRTVSVGDWPIYLPAGRASVVQCEKEPGPTGNPVPSRACSRTASAQQGYGSSTTFPVVCRPASALCASAASANG